MTTAIRNAILVAAIAGLVTIVRVIGLLGPDADLDDRLEAGNAHDVVLVHVAVDVERRRHRPAVGKRLVLQRFLLLLDVDALGSTDSEVFQDLLELWNCRLRFGAWDLHLL